MHPHTLHATLAAVCGPQSINIMAVVYNVFTSVGTQFSEDTAELHQNIVTGLIVVSLQS